MSGGPKNYEDGREKTVSKVRDIYLNYNASEMVNFDVNRDMILEGTRGMNPPR